jgi:sugar lactone lactonase YvrE
VRPILAALAALLLLPAAAGAAPRAKWDTKLLARIPAPGYPAFAYPHPNGRIYVGTYENPSGDSVRSKVLEYTGGGALLRSWIVPGQDLSKAHGVQAATSDAQGRMVLLVKSPARAVQLDTRTGRFHTYATFATLPGKDGASPNYAAWGRDGSLYVTDYAQAVVWRVPPGGGPARVWLSDPRLDGGQFGTTGLMLGADRRTLYVMQGSSMGGGDGNPATGKLYTVPIEAGDRPGPMRRLWESAPTDVPDGFAIAKSGRIYAALVGLPQQLAVIEPDGRDGGRFPSARFTGANGSEAPFDSPSSARFRGNSLIVANQSYVQGDPSHWTIMDVNVGEPGLKELIPFNAGAADQTRPRISRVRFRGRNKVSLRLSEKALVRVWLRRGDRHRTFVRRGRRGANTFSLGRMHRGRYAVHLRARDATGWTSKVVKRTRRVR